MEDKRFSLVCSIQTGDQAHPASYPVTIFIFIFIYLLQLGCYPVAVVILHVMEVLSSSGTGVKNSWTDTYAFVIAWSLNSTMVTA